MKVNPFGLFIKLDEEIHGLAHISQLNLGVKEKITELFKSDEVRDFEIVSVSPSEHRLGLKLADGKKSKKAEKEEAEEAVEAEEKTDEKKTKEKKVAKKKTAKAE